MKKVILLVVLAVVSMSVKAQSCDGAYPMGNWDSEYPNYDESKPYAVQIDVTRCVTSEMAGQGQLPDGISGCGTVFITDNKKGESVLAGWLNYAGKGMAGNMGNGIYYFNVGSEKGSFTMGLKKTEGGMEIVSMTGTMANHPVVKMKIAQTPPNGSWTPVGIEAENDRDILDDLRNALKDNDKERVAYRTQGFGNVREFITAHANLDPSKPKYLKPKGTGAINIRRSPSTTAAKIGELPAGQTLLVVDEYNGWCQVQLESNKYGFVSLSVVTLTNTASATTGATAASASSAGAAASSFVLGNGKLGPLRIDQTVASLPKSVPGLYDRFEYKKEEIENEMEGSWTEEWCYFYKGGKEIFKCEAGGRKLSSFVLEEGSGFIKTSEGFYVGCPARDVFSKKRMQWETWYTGTAFARNGHWEYHIPDEGLNGVEYPTKLADVKQTAKISMIVYYKGLPQ